MILFNKREEETCEQLIERTIKEEAGKNYMHLSPDWDMRTEELDMFYKKGWELISESGHLTIRYIFKKKKEEMLK